MSTTVERLTLHPEGPSVSRIAAGFWRLHEWNMTTKTLTAFIEHALELGITTFDHADIYGSYGNEEMFGKVLKQRPDLRKKMEIVTKCGICLTTDNRPENTVQHYNTTAKYIRNSVERSLRNFHTDCIDVVLIHRPDPLMQAAETANIFMALRKEGKIRHAGVSNFTPAQFELLQSRLDVPLVTNQVECSPLHLDPIYDGTFDQAQRKGISPMIWSPFAGGELFRASTERGRRIRLICNQLSEKHAVTPAQIMLAWVLAFPCNPQPVLGTGKPSRLTEAAKASEIKLDRQDWFEILQASQGHPVP